MCLELRELKRRQRLEEARHALSPAPRLQPRCSGRLVLCVSLDIFVQLVEDGADVAAGEGFVDLSNGVHCSWLPFPFVQSLLDQLRDLRYLLRHRDARVVEAADLLRRGV